MDATNKAIGTALGGIMKGRLTQVQIAESLDIDQTTVSRWIHGKDSIPAYRIPQLENILELPAGALWSAAGLADSRGVINAVYADDNLSGTAKETVRRVYESLLGT